MINEKFNLENSYIEIFLTKVISKEDLLSLLNNEGVTFKDDFNLKKASQFDMGITLMNDVSNDKLLPKIRDLQKNKYSWTKSLERTKVLIDKITDWPEVELAQYYTQISTNGTMQSFVTDILNGTNKAPFYKKDLLFLVVEELVKKEDI